MWNKQKSLLASVIMTVILFFIIIAAMFLLPSFLKVYSEITGRVYGGLIVPLYGSMVLGLIAVVSLLALLMNIRKNEIFIRKNVTVLRILSWCCIFVGVDFLVFGRGYISMLLLSFAAFFFGLILRVIKNVFDKAILIREENDYTI